jgi:DNA end-binding protein Ku
MAGHSIWTGSISFGLVTIPVSLRTAVEEHDLKFTMLDKDGLSPVGYLHVNKKTGKEVEWADIVKGYEYKKGKYVVLSKEDFTKANVKANQLLEIEDFVDASEVDPVYFDKPYYIVPAAQGVRAYELLRETLARTGKIGIGRVVMHTKQHVVAVMPMGDVLILEVMRFAHEVRPTKDLEMPAAAGRKVTDREVDMAEQLVSGMTSRFKPEKYKDTYHDDLMRLIEKKIKLGTTAEVEAYNEPAEEVVGRKGEVIDLMPLLKASLGRGRTSKDDKGDDDGETEEPRARAGARAGGKNGRGAKVTPIEKARKARAARGSTRKTSTRSTAKATSKSKATKATARSAPERAAAGRGSR